MPFNFIPRGSVEIPEISIKEELFLPADKTAVIVVDMQNDFVKPGGTLVVEAAAADSAEYRRSAGPSACGRREGRVHSGYPLCRR